MKKSFLVFVCAVLCIASMSYGAAKVSFIPVHANVGSWGNLLPAPINGWPADCYWVWNNGYGTSYCLGKIGDEKAKAMYATVLTAIANGWTIELGLYNLDQTTATAPGTINYIPEYVLIK